MTHIRSKVWNTGQRSMNPHSFTVNIEHGSVTGAVNDSTHRMTLPVSHGDIIKVDKGTKSRINPICPIGNPDCLPRAPEVEAKVANPVAYALANDVAIIALCLADGGKDGEVCHERWRRVGREGDHRLAIKPHGISLQEDDLARNDGTWVVEEVLFTVGHWTATEVATRTITVTVTS